MGSLLLMIALVRDNQQTRTSIQVLSPKYEKSTLQGRDYVYYTILSGDTLPLLERKFRVTSRKAILDLNPDLDPDNLPVNHRIKIPLQ